MSFLRKERSKEGGQERGMGDVQSLTLINLLLSSTSNSTVKSS